MAGRPPDAGEARDAYLRVRLAEFEMRYLELARDGMNRSDYVRHLIRTDAEAKGLV